MLLGIFLVLAMNQSGAAGEGSAASIELKEQSAIAYGPGGVPMFRGGRAFLLAYAGNADGTVFQTDPIARRIRISADGQQEVWLSCDELASSVASCASTQRAGDTASATPPRSRTIRGGGVPNCPGDPRCPRIGSK